jgi:hypothetical protein
MLWLGVQGRKKIAALEELLGILEQRLEQLEKAFQALDLEMTDRVDRLNGIAKRIQGRRGGRPPADGDSNAEGPQPEFPNGFSRHVL